MWFSKKKKAYKEIYGGIWGHLLSKHRLDVDTLTRDVRCVERPGTLNGGMPVTFLRVFRLTSVEKKGVEVKGWETFDAHPELIAFEGYINSSNEAFLEPKK